MKRIRALAFDCDGVLLDSNELKTACFRLALEKAGFHPEDVARFETFQRASFGTSRYRLFDTFLSWDLRVSPGADRAALIALYASELKGRYVLTPATPGMGETTSRLAERFPLFVVSGSDQEELREVLAARGDAARFRAIHGSPRTKVENLRLVLGHEACTKAGVAPDELLFVGDARADLEAAWEVGCQFIYMDGYSSAQAEMREMTRNAGVAQITDLREIEAQLSLTPLT